MIPNLVTVDSWGVPMISLIGAQLLSVKIEIGSQWRKGIGNR